MASIMTVWAIDPGDIHVGFAEFTDEGVCLSATETTPERLCDLLHTSIVDHIAPSTLVIERFALRGELMAQQQGSEFKTSQLIGALKVLSRIGGITVVMQTPWQAKSLLKHEPYCHWKPGQWPSFRHGPHAKDAFLHGERFFTHRKR